MKTVDKAKLTSENLKKTVEHEIRILKRLRHTRIVRLYEVIETPRSIILILEYVDGGTVQQLVKKHKRLEEADAQRILYQLVDAVEHCHNHHVCHRDLKLENFVLDRQQRTVKLIDFGLSVIWRDDQALFKSYGTPCYTAPEIMSGLMYRGPEVDVWSLGVSLATMLTGTLPFQALNSHELKRRVVAGRYTLPEALSAESRDLVRQMLTVAPQHRIRIPHIRQHCWLRGVSEQQGGSFVEHEDASLGLINASALQQLGASGLDTAVVERSIRERSFNHEAACYELLRMASARKGTTAARASGSAPPSSAREA